MKKAYLVVGCPGSGKTWVCEQLTGKYNYIPHDLFIDGPTREAYLAAIVSNKSQNKKPLLIETPFSISQIMEPLKKSGFEVEPVFIQEHDDVIRKRYFDREKKEIPRGHLTRQMTYAQRAKEHAAFSGTSKQILDYLIKKH